ncbi:MAG: TetR family transcriptional regulator [Pontimonas sp.]
MGDISPLRRDTRATPIQQRSSERIEAILSATATIIDQEGIDAVTTTSVAFRSGSSVGVIYRYFPNIDSLLHTLAQRNLHLYLDKVQEGSDRSPEEPWSSWDFTLDSYIDLCRHEPGFRSLGFGDIITNRFLSTEESNTSVIAKAFAGMVSETHQVPVTKEMLFHLECAITMGMALVSLAFERKARGDRATIEQARVTIGEYLRTHLPISSSTR